MIAHVRSSLNDRRWVAIVGPSGVGKTLIARHAVHGLDPAWVDARGLTDIDDLLARWLPALSPDIAPGDSPLLTLSRTLDEGGRLSVLDGVSEHLAEPLRDLVESVLASTSEPRILSTGDVPTGSADELDIRVSPFPVPLPDEPLSGTALELFVGRLASAGGPLVDLHRDETVLRSLITASAGLPLIIEQMAAQAAQVGLAAVAPPDSLASAVEASYAMVDPATQAAYRRLGSLGFDVSLDLFAALANQPRALAIGTAAQLERHSLLEISSAERVQMHLPARRHALALARDTSDAAQALSTLVSWSDAALPGADEGSASDPWLPDYPAVEAAIRCAAADSDTRDLAYDLANRAFGPLYTAMRSRDALTLLETVLDSGDGPPEVGAQVARRAGICASELLGTFEGLRFLERAEQHAIASANPGAQQARTSSIRAEMYLDAGQLDAARAEVARLMSIDGVDSYALRQARRTLMDVEVSSGNLARAEALAGPIIDGATGEEAWLGIAARVLCSQIAWAQGREVEALAAARAARQDAVARGEDRIALLADVLARRISGAPAVMSPEPEELPWAVRLGYQLQGARDIAARGEFAQAAGLAADVVVLADSARLERDGIEARIVLADAFLAQGDLAQASSTYAAAARRAAGCPLPLLAADAFDGLALCLRDARPDHAGKCAWVAAALRSHRGAVAHARPGVDWSLLPTGRPAPNWLTDGQLSAAGVEAASRLEAGQDAAATASPLASLTRAQRAVAELVGAGMTSKEIAERLYLSPRTVDNHLATIYRRLEIPSRARLAALMADLS